MPLHGARDDPWVGPFSTYEDDRGSFDMDPERHVAHGFDDVESPHVRPWGEKPFRLTCDCGEIVCESSPAEAKAAALEHLAGKR